MPTQDNWQWEQDVMGGHYTYPGHPIVLATMVMDRYESFEHACYNAISDSFIPGAGCAVSATMAVLKLASMTDSGSVEAAFTEAERYWKGWEDQSPRNAEAAASGRVQAEGVKPAFLERLTAWKRGEPMPSKYRLAAVPAVAED